LPPREITPVKLPLSKIPRRNLAWASQGRERGHAGPRVTPELDIKLEICNGSITIDKRCKYIKVNKQ